MITNAKDYLGKIVTVKIDRALGTKHPKHGFIYTVNYGYIEGTISGDGEELDAYVLGVFEPCTEFTGRVISYIHRTNDNDDKLNFDIFMAPHHCSWTYFNNVPYMNGETDKPVESSKTMIKDHKTNGQHLLQIDIVLMVE